MKRTHYTRGRLPAGTEPGWWVYLLKMARHLPAGWATLAVLLMLATSVGCAAGHASTAHLRAELVDDGFASPVQLASPADGSGRLFVVDQVGVIWLIKNGRRNQVPFLDIRSRLVRLLDVYDERGLLGLALHPRFAASGRFYVYYSAPLRLGLAPDKWDHTTRISEFRVSAQDPDRADPASERVVLEIDKPGYNYEGGGLAFGPDGMLYIGTGDSVRDPSLQAGAHAQDTRSLLGKILRVDVDVYGETAAYGIPPDNPFVRGGGRPEIFAYGFRNPYRLSFDGTRMFVGDVGQALAEEADVVQAGGNYGWPVREGTACFNSRDWQHPLPRCASQGMTDPIITYPHAGKTSAIIGGVVYHGGQLRGLDGAYIFGDWGRGAATLFAASQPAGAHGSWRLRALAVELPGSENRQLLWVGAGSGGQLYILAKDLGIGPQGTSGALYRITAP